MIRVNLLPHREMRRAEKQREFGLMCVLVAVTAASVLFTCWTYVVSKIELQEQRNQRLETQIGYLDKEIAAIAGLKEQIQHVMDRKQIVENLQTDRNQAVMVLNELATQLPEGTFLKSIKQQEDLIELKGVADTNARVASLVHNLRLSSMLQNPNLVEIKASDNTHGVRQFEFVLKITLKLDTPSSGDKSASPATANPAK